MLTTLIGVIVVILGLICWVGQTMIVFLLPAAILKQHGKSVGRPSSVRSANVIGSLWILSSITMIALAVTELNA